MCIRDRDLVQSKNKYSLIEESKSVEEFFSSFVMNYKISKSWQLESLSNNNLQSKIENFGIGESIIMLTPNDGIYNISGKDAIDLGANNIIGKLFSEIRIKNKEKLIPFYIVDKDSNNSFDLNLSLIHHLRAHETVLDLVCRLLLEKKKN